MSQQDRIKGQSTFQRRKFPRLINFEFVLIPLYYQSGSWGFVKWDTSGEYKIYQALDKDKKLKYPFGLLHMMWMTSALYPSPRLLEYFRRYNAAVEEQLEKGATLLWPQTM